MNELWEQYKGWILAILVTMLGLQLILWPPWKIIEQQQMDELKVLQEYNRMQEELIDLMEKRNELLEQEILIKQGKMWSA